MAETIENTHFIVEPGTILADTMKSFDIYYKNGENLVLFSANGQDVSEEMQQKISDQKIDKFFIQNKDKNYYTLYIEEILSSILTDPDISTEVKAKTAYDAICTAAVAVFKSPQGAIVKRYKQAVFDTIDYIFQEEDALQQMIKLTTFDFTTFNHSVNVGLFSVGLMKEILADKTDHDIEEVAAGFFLHDIGKTAIPHDILNKRGPLSPVEWKIIKRHPEEGLQILDKLGELTDEAKLIVMQHHERHNGSGYPQGLKGDQIHVYGRICSIADSFDGLTSYRPYRKEFTTFNALKIMKNDMFKDFDPNYFATFLKLFSV